MAYKPLRPCRHPGCRVLVRGGYCDAHQAEHRPTRPYKRGESAAWHRLYSLPVWTERLRPAQLAREPFCRACWQQRHERVHATEVDHIVPHRGVMALFLDAGNLQSLCHKCHSEKTMHERAERNRGKPRG